MNRPIERACRWALCCGLLAAGCGAAVADEPVSDDRPRREIFVPYADLNVVLENQPRRVLMSRGDFDDLLKRARKTPEKHVPHPALLLSADYEVDAAPQRATIRGTLRLEVMDDGLHLLPLDLSGVGLTDATLDGRSAAIGRLDDGRVALVVEGVGRHELKLEMVAPLETTAARQVLNFKLPRPPAAQMKLSVPGDVELKSGAEIVSREVDAEARVTRFQLVPRSGDTALVMTLNSHMEQRQQAVVATSVLLSEVTSAYEKLHATVSLAVLYRAVDEFRFALPTGFEVQEVASPLLSRWDIVEQDGRRVLRVRLREQTTDRVVLNISAVKTDVSLDDWTAPRLEPLDVVGQVAVVGLLLENRLRPVALSGEGVVPIDVAALEQALPASVLNAAPGTPLLRPVAAWYAAQSNFTLTGQFERPAATMAVNTNLLLILDDRGQQVVGGFSVLPQIEKRFSLDFSVPAGWHVERVTGPDEQPLRFERHGAADAAGRVHVRLPAGIPADAEYAVHFRATHTPKGWLADWQSREIAFPVFQVVAHGNGAPDDTISDEGAIAVSAGDDMIVLPGELAGLMPLGEAEKADYGLTGVATHLAYRYEDRDYKASIAVSRTAPRATARTLAFFQVRPAVLGAHYELIYLVDEARTRRLVFSLPADTPATISVRGLDGLGLKEYTPEIVGDQRRWTVLLREAQRGRLRLAVSFDRPLPENAAQQHPLPMISADEVVYQSGLVAVEGSAELKATLKTTARQVDVGELAEADYQPGRRLLGAYGFTGKPPAVTVDVVRDPAYEIFPAIVERAELITQLSPDGVSQTEANFRLRSKALFLELKLPDGAELWSAMLDGTPIKPHRVGQSVLIGLPADAPDATRTLQFVYAAEVRRVAFAASVEVPAPRLLLRADRDKPGEEVPLSDVFWRLHVPAGYEVTRSGGTLTTLDVERPLPAALHVGAVLYALGGGVHPFYGAQEAARKSAQMSMQSGMERGAWGKSKATPADKSAEYPPGDEASYAPKADEPTMPATPPAAAEPAPADEMMQLEPMQKRTEELAKEQSERDGRDGAMPGPATDPFSAPSVIPPPKPAEPTPVPPAQAGEGKKSELRDLPLAIMNTDLRGVRSLRIDLAEAQGLEGGMLFRSLGVEPRLEVTLANRTRFNILGWGLFFAVLLWGFTWTNRTSSSKFKLIIWVAVLATAVPLVWRSVEVAHVSNFIFYAAALLAPYYLLAGLLKIILLGVRRQWTKTATATILLAFAMGPMALAAEADAPPKPVAVPDDAIIVPYDPVSPADVEPAERLMVPYAQYVELWNRAHPDKKIDAKSAPVPFAFAGGAYTVTLDGDDYVTLVGRFEVDVYADGHVAAPLSLAGGMLARAEVDGEPARITLVAPDAQSATPNSQPVAQQAQQAAATSPAMTVLNLSGKGRKVVNLTIRLKTSRQGGWRAATGTVPVAPATKLTLTVPEPQTEIRLGHVLDRRSYETQQPGEQIVTAIGVDGAVKLEWRPKVAEAQVDRSLTARSIAVFDIEEDGLRVVWRLSLEFPRSQRDRFTIAVPADYLVENVAGANVRGWQLAEDRQTVEVELLETAKDREELIVSLWRTGLALPAEFAVPAVGLPDAALHSGEVTIRRSPLLDVRTLQSTGVTRTDANSDAPRLAGDEARQRPWGIRPYEAYRFATMPFAIRLTAAAVEPTLSAEVQAIVRIAAFQRLLEAQVLLEPQGRPIHRAEIFLPEGLKLESVVAPGEYQWSVAQVDKRPMLTVFLAQGRESPTAIVLRGTLAREAPQQRVPLPRLEVRGAERQRGEIVVQVDPAFDVVPVDLVNAESPQLGRVSHWLKPEQRALARVAIAYREADFAGFLRLTRRKPDVTSETITNVSVGSRTIEETILLDFSIKEAGVSHVAFRLPAGMAGCRVKARDVRQRRIEAQPDGQLRVTLEFQDEMMGQLRVIVEHDRLLEPKAEYSVPIPVVETGQTNRQYIAIENAGRDEVEFIDAGSGVSRLNRELSEYHALAEKLPGRTTQAFLVETDAERPELRFRLREREAVETAGARVLMAETTLVIDANGAYRAQQTYRIDNSTEQYLDVRLPDGAELWTAMVAGEPVKPVRDPKAADDRGVRVPLVKTAAGDLDYEVVFRYGGKLPALWGLSTVDFPLMRTAGAVRPEASIVELRVPKNFRWMRFGGTMRLVKHQQDVQKEYEAYLSKQLSNISQSLRSTDVYTQLRANRAKLDLERRLVDRSRSSSADDIAQNEVAAAQSQPNMEAFRQIEQEIDRIQRDQSIVVAGDNRKTLNDAFDDQTNTRANNVVQNLGRNWMPADQAAKRDDGDFRFNSGWLDANKLSGDALDDLKGTSSTGAQQSTGKVVWEGKPGSKLARNPKAPEVAQQQLREQLTQSQSKQIDEQREGQSLAEDQLSNVRRYSERLQVAQSYNMPGQGQAGAQPTAPSGEGGRLMLGVGVNSDAGLTGETIMPDAFSADLDVPFAQGAEKAGLASLQIAMPEHDVNLYDVYRFTTPLGQTEITGWAVSEELLASLGNLGIVAVILLLVLGMASIIRGRALGALTSSHGSTMLVVLGLLMVLGGIFPILGLVALGFGIAAKIRRAQARASEKVVTAEVVR